MNNGHDKIDDVFREGLNGIKGDLPDSFFEESWAKSSPGKIQTSPASGLSTLYIIIPAAMVILGSVYFFSTEAKIKNAELVSAETSEINYTRSHSGDISTSSADFTENLITDNTNNINEKKSKDIKQNNNVAINESTPNSKYSEISTNNKEIANAVKTNETTQNNQTVNSIKKENLTNTPVENSINYSSDSENENKVTLNENVSSETVKNSESDLKNEITFATEKYGIISSKMMYVKNTEDIKINSPADLLMGFNPAVVSQFNPAFWSAEIYASANYLFSKIKAVNPENDMLAESRQNSLNPGLSSFNYGLLLNYHKRFYILSAGINYNSFTEHTDYGMVLFNPQINYEQYYNGTPYNFTLNGNYYQVDSSSYWHYTYVVDSVLHIADSVQGFEIDTNLVSVFDSLAFSKFDTADYSKLKAKYSLIEIPLYAGIEINRGKWGYAISAGIIPGFLIRQSGSFINGSNEITLPDGLFPMRKFVLSGGLKIQFNYYPGTRLMLFAGPEAKISLINASEKNSGLSQKWYTVGLRGGIRYFF